ncbi:MAG: glucokinase [Gammaproteobacteria bacterium]|nr:glucokinase [Gammaproteobacteria bacterium]
MLVLAGDIGGTKTLLQLGRFNAGQTRAEVIAEQRFDSQAYPAPGPMVETFLQSHQPEGTDRTDIQACFGIAGPVTPDGKNQQAQLTNLLWQLDSLSLSREIGLGQLKLINDFQAIGYGIEALYDEDLTPLQQAAAKEGGPRVIIGAGTGLGVAQLFATHDGYEVFSSEGGHLDFAPQNDTQDALLTFLRQQYGHVSYERLLSGMGLENIYRFLLTQSSGGDTRSDALLGSEDPAAAISQQAFSDESSLASHSLRLFCEVYGAMAGNMALTALATGGVYISGGIATKILPALQQGDFIKAFNAKGRMSRLTQSMPVHVVTNPQVGLLGAALAASRL